MGSLYIHIPYCDTKCVYCDFYSIENHESKKEFLNSLLKEISIVAQTYSKQDIFETIFFGGGTPSLLSPNELESILLSLNNNFTVSENAEITLEANPGTVNLEKLKSYRSLGVNRISFGVQSFHEDELKFLSRIHSVDQARDAVNLSRKAGFDNLNIDLMFSLPKQTEQKLKYSLNEAFQLSPEHISAYSLIVEPNTPLFNLVKNKIVSPLPPDDDADLYKVTLEEMEKNGFHQYEVSNFCKSGFHSKHNSNYWNHSNYLGFGPSAHSFWKINSNNAKRWWNHRNITQYCNDISNGILPIFSSEQLTTKELLQESLFLGFRSQGIEVKSFNKEYGFDIFTKYSSNINRYIQENLMMFENNMLRLTQQGYMVCDSISESFL